MAELWVARIPGQVPYQEAVELQTRLRERRQAGAIPDALLLLEHPPTYTKGRRSERADLPMGEEWYWSQGIGVHETTRGGRVTYHGPGQLVGYPIMGVTDVVAFLRTMEAGIIRALADERVEAEGPEGLTGVGGGGRQIGSNRPPASRGRA